MVLGLCLLIQKGQSHQINGLLLIMLYFYTIKHLYIYLIGATYITFENINPRQSDIYSSMPKNPKYNKALQHRIKGKGDTVNELVEWFSTFDPKNASYVKVSFEDSKKLLFRLVISIDSLYEKKIKQNFGDIILFWNL